VTTEATTTARADVTILVDNRAAVPGLIEEHGFAAWVETPETRLLLDTGQGAALMPNASALLIDFGRADALCLSHGHYDHTGGLPDVLAATGDAPVYMHPDALRPRFRPLDTPPHKAIGMPAATARALQAAPGRTRWTDRPTWVGPGLLLTGPIPREVPSDAGAGFFTDALCTVPDPLADDQALVICTPRGVSVLTGCCHAGIVNTLRHAAKLTGATRLEAVIGGFHLLHASQREMDDALDAFVRYQVSRIIPCHCTGDAAARLIQDRFGPLCGPCGAGQVVLL
jgi:7,8-dihydropterin-6-yl-methyl-4-(beta-D-ribofuranosyl)aminobenzene 5'-phosphate synthase